MPSLAALALLLQEEVVAAQLLLLVELRVQLVDTRTVVLSVTAESDVQGLQELVATSKEGLGLVGVCVNTGLSVKDNDTVGKVSRHDEIVLDDESSLLGVHDPSLDDLGSHNTLLGVEVGTGLVNDVDVGGLSEGQDNGDTLKFTTRQVLDVLVNKAVQLEGLDDLGLELRKQEGGSDLLEEELANGTLKLGVDGLRLHGDGHLGHLGSTIGLERTSQHLTESGLSGTVLSKHDNDLRVGKVTSVNLEVEVSLGLLHGGVLESARLVVQELVGTLGHLEGEGLVTETQVLGGDVTVEEDVDTLTNRVGKGNNTVDTGLSVENADEITDVVEDTKIVLYHNDVVVVPDERSNHGSGLESLLDIEERTGLVEQVDILLLDADETESESLQLTTGKVGDVTVVNVSQLQNIENLVEVAHGLIGLLGKDGADGALSTTEGLGNLVDILRLDDGVEIILEQLGEVALQFGTTEVADDVGPIGGIFVQSAQVGLELAGEDLECSTLTNTVGSYETENLTGSGGRQTLVWVRQDLEVGQRSVWLTDEA